MRVEECPLILHDRVIVVPARDHSAQCRVPQRVQRDVPCCDAGALHAWAQQLALLEWQILIPHRSSLSLFESCPVELRRFTVQLFCRH